VKIGLTLGEDWAYFGSRLGLDLLKIGLILGEDWAHIGSRLGLDWP
jgi:hypothetical protein